MNPALRQVAITTTPEAEEAVRVLLQTTFDTEASVHTRSGRRDPVVSVYLPEDKKITQAERQTVSDGLKIIRDCGLPVGNGKLTAKKLRREDWVDSWKRHFQPIDIAGQLLIKPLWRKDKPAPGQKVIHLDPGLSFGTGHHATTKYCLRQLVAIHHAHASGSVLDVGTGTGILAIAAAKLGFGPIAAFDFDQVAVQVASENVRRNRVARKVQPEFGDITQMPARATPGFDLVFANLTENVLIEGSDGLIGRVNRGGALVIAGVLDSQFTQVQAAFERQGMKRQRSARSGQWRSGVFVHA